ncbi:MAG: hypothetical protein AB2385_01870 [Symbiobacterium sp.]|uniref:hypothetical protein n=1 Tax=Symbiobacterium sp. TaxID=1971213 RepID=UPI003463FEC5
MLLGDGPMDLFPKGLPGAQNHIDHDKGLDEEDYHENRGAPGANYKRQCRASKPRQDSVQPVLRIVLGHCDEVGNEGDDGGDPGHRKEPANIQTEVLSDKKEGARKEKEPVGHPVWHDRDPFHSAIP